MSNFICSECGMNHIDCGSSGYKTPKEIDLEKQIERLQEQLESAQDVIYEYIKIYGVERECSKYLEKYAKRTK